MRYVTDVTVTTRHLFSSLSSSGIVLGEVIAHERFINAFCNTTLLRDKLQDSVVVSRKTQQHRTLMAPTIRAAVCMACFTYRPTVK